MRSIVFLLLSLCAAAPALARFTGPPPREHVRRPDPFIGDSSLPGPRASRQAHKVGKAVERARESGALSRQEARQLKREARLIGTLERLYARDGLSASERAELDTRTHVLRGKLNRSRSGPSQATRRGGR